jgi:hypothetical protein
MGVEVQLCSFTTSALEGVHGQRHAPAALPPKMRRYSFYRRSGGPWRRFGRVRQIFPPRGFEPWTVQAVASRYTEEAIPAAKQNECGGLNFSIVSQAVS